MTAARHGVANTPSSADAALVAAYEESLATRPNRTREAYLRDVGVLKALAGQASITTLPAATLRRFLAALHARGLSGRSLARILSGWRAFYRFVLERDSALLALSSLWIADYPTKIGRHWSPEKTAQMLSEQRTALRALGLWPFSQ